MLAFLIHPEVRNPTHKDYRNTRIATHLLFIILIALLFYSAYFFVYQFEDTVKNISNIFGLVFLILALALIRLTASFVAPLSVLLFISLVLTSTSIYHTGGIYSVDISWLFLTVVVSCFFLNITIGVVFFVFAAGYIFYLYFLENSFVESTSFFSNYVTQSNATHYLFTWIFVLLFLLILVIVFVKTLENSNKKVEEMQKNQLEELTRLVAVRNKEIHTLRGKLAQDFHDEVSNKLAGIRMISETIGVKSNQNLLEKDDMIASLKTIETRSKELYQGTKDFIWSVSDNSDKVSELFTYLSDQLYDLYNLQHIDFKSNINLDNKNTNAIAPSVSRQIILLFNEFSITVCQVFNLKAFNIDFITKNNSLVITAKCILTTQNTSVNYEHPLLKIKNRLDRIHAVCNYEIHNDLVIYTFKISLSELQ